MDLGLLGRECGKLELKTSAIRQLGELNDDTVSVDHTMVWSGKMVLMCSGTCGTQMLRVDGDDLVLR